MPAEKFSQELIPYLVEADLLTPLWRQKEIITGIVKMPLLSAEFQTANKRQVGFTYIQKAVGLYKERLKKLSEIGQLADYFFKDPEYDRGLLFWKKMNDAEVKASLDKSYNALSEIKEKNWAVKPITEKLMAEASAGSRGEAKPDKGALLWPLRAALSGKKASAPPFDIAFLLGREKTLQRIKQAQAKL